MTVTGSQPLRRTPLAEGFCFGEGPRWFEGLLWFSDMLGEAVHTVTLDGAFRRYEAVLAGRPEEADWRA